MARIRLALVVLPVLLVSVAAADISGSWRMSFKADWTSIPDLVCTLSHKDQRLEGTCKEAGGGDGKGMELNDGRVEGDQVSWTWKVVVPDGETWTYAVAVTVDADGTTMKGVAKLSSRFSTRPGEVSLTAKKQ